MKMLNACKAAFDATGNKRQPEDAIMTIMIKRQKVVRNVMEIVKNKSAGINMYVNDFDAMDNEIIRRTNENISYFYHAIVYEVMLLHKHGKHYLANVVIPINWAGVSDKKIKYEIKSLLSKMAKDLIWFSGAVNSNDDETLISGVMDFVRCHLDILTPMVNALALKSKMNLKSEHTDQLRIKLRDYRYYIASMYREAV